MAAKNWYRGIHPKEQSGSIVSKDKHPQWRNEFGGHPAPTVDEWEKQELHHRAWLATKPGLTGMRLVSRRNKITDFNEAILPDTEYIENWSIGLDIQILLKTVVTVIKGRGAM